MEDTKGKTTQHTLNKKPQAANQAMHTYILHIQPSPSNHLRKMFSRQMVFSLP